MSFGAVIDRCVDRWLGQGISLSPPVGEAEVREAWGRLGLHLSRDVLLLYTTVGGFAEDCWDEDFWWSLWPWDYLLEQNFGDRSQGVRFCDHSIQLVTWEVRYENERRSSVWRSCGTGPEVMCASSLESFFQMYLDDPWLRLS